MTTIIKQMEKGAKNRAKKELAEKELLRLELALINAYDFCPHKVEYYKQCIANHKETFKKYL